MLLFLLSITDESNHDIIEKIYNNYHDKMLVLAEQKLLRFEMNDYKNNAEDAVQNAFVKIVKNIDRIDFSRGENDVRNYIFSILTNEILNILDENEDLLEFDEERYQSNEYDIIDELDMQEIYEKLVIAVEKLDEKYTTTLYLFFDKGMSIEEIAKMMDIPTKTVYTRFERGKKLLKNAIKENK